MRALPSFSHSPPSSNCCQGLTSQRCRAKSKDRPANVRSPGLCVTPPTRKPESPTHLVSHKSDTALTPTLHVSPPAFHHITTETKAEHRPGGMEEWEPEEDDEEAEGLGYVMMSPQGSHSSPFLSRDDYVIMASPQKHSWPDSSALQTSVNR